MLTDSIYSKIQRHLTFGILPLFYIWLSFIFHHRLQAFHFNNTDPVYAYLFNGVNLAGGYLEIGHTDHPGTPMQCLVALIIFIKHLITGHGPVYQDVILHPESYLQTICIVLALLLGLVTYLTATYVYKHTAGMALAIFFQCTPLFNDRFFHFAFLPESECLIIIASTFFMAYLYVNAFYKPETEQSKQGNNYGMYIIAGLFSTLLIASKITCAPLVLICLFVAENYKQRILYLISLPVFFFLFISPAISKLGNMYNWVLSLFLHEGHYGAGRADILNPEKFTLNLIDIFKSDTVFTLVYSSLTIALITVILTPGRKLSLIAVYKRSIIGLWLAFTIIIIAVAKHYLFTYLIPVQSCFALATIILYKSIHSFIKLEKLRFTATKVIYPISLTLFIILICNSVAYAFKESGQYKSAEVTQKFLENYRNIPVINTSVYGSAYVDPSLYFGIIYSGEMRYKYFQFAKKVYPDSYNVIYETGRLVFWDDEIAPAEILKKSSKVLVYCKKIDSLDRVHILHTICIWNDSLELGKSKLIYADREKLEYIYLIESDSALAAKLLSNKTEIDCDLEKLNDDKSKFVASDSLSLFDKASLLTHSEHHSGQNSIQLDKNNQFGLDFNIPVKPHCLINVTIWAKNVLHNGFIYLTGTDGSFYAGNAAIIDTGSNGWEQIMCRVIVPADYKEKTAKFYIQYVGNDKVWFDDLRITVYPMQLLKSRG